MRSSSRMIGWGMMFVLAAALGIWASAVLAQEAGTSQETPTPGATGEAAPAEGAPAIAPPSGLSEALPSVDEASVEKEQLSPLGFMVDWFQIGGVFMWPLLLCAVVGVAVCIERLWTLNRAQTNVARFMSQVVGAMKEGGVKAGIDVCQRTRGPIAAILHAGLMRAHQGPEAVEKAIESAGTVEMAFLQRGLIVLATVINVAPLLGFLGTVSGMIHAFDAIAAAEQVSAKLVASGISEALITTEAGLCIAIPIQSFTNFFISRIDRFVLEMEEASIEVLDTLVELKEQGRA